MSKDDSQFISFHSPADLDQVLGGTNFAATWRVKNNGTTHWKLGYHLVNRIQSLMVRKRLPLFEATGKHNVAPGEEVDVTLLFTAPEVLGRHKHVFQLANGKGQAFGDQFWIDIVVVDEDKKQGDGASSVPASKERLQTGMNISPDAAHSNPQDVGVLTGLDWVRFPFKVADKKRTVADSFAEYDPIVAAYAKKGIGTLFVLNQQTVAGKNAPWKNGDWGAYANQFASAAGQIADHYAHLGDKVAFEVWNEEDNQDTPWVSIYVPPKHYAKMLWRTASAIRNVSPDSKVIFGGLSTDHAEASFYVKQVRRALGGDLPVDAIGIHPYGRWPGKRPFRSWGFGSLDKELKGFAKQISDKPLWITEIGIVGEDKPLPEDSHPVLAQYMRDFYKSVANKHSDQVEAVIWFAWSDNMQNAGIVRADGTAKSEILDAFIAVRDRKLDGLA